MVDERPVEARRPRSRVRSGTCKPHVRSPRHSSASCSTADARTRRSSVWAAGRGRETSALRSHAPSTTASISVWRIDSSANRSPGRRRSCSVQRAATQRERVRGLATRPGTRRARLRDRRREPAPTNSRRISVTTGFWIPLGEIAARRSVPRERSSIWARNRASTARRPVRRPRPIARAGPSASCRRSPVLAGPVERINDEHRQPARSTDAAAARTSRRRRSGQAEGSCRRASPRRRVRGPRPGSLGPCRSLTAACSSRVASASNRAMSSRSPGSAFWLRPVADGLCDQRLVARRRRAGR